MGTNYYALVEQDNPIFPRKLVHIGKSSAGWKFIFDCSHGYYNDIGEFMSFIADKEILDEYDERVDKGNFLARILEKQTQRSHVLSCPEHKTCYMDKYGFEFCRNEFI